MSIGNIRGLKSGITKLDGFSNVVYYGDSAKLAKLKQLKTSTDYFCKPLKVECEFCKEKIGLLKNDVFEKSSKNFDKE